MKKYTMEQIMNSLLPQRVMGLAMVGMAAFLMFGMKEGTASALIGLAGAWALATKERILL